MNKLITDNKEIYINIEGREFLITPNPFDDNTLELREGNTEKGFDIVEIISSLDYLLKYTK